MSHEYKIGEVFLDTENFEKPKRVKCIEDKIGEGCSKCIYIGDLDSVFYCERIICTGRESSDGISRIYLQTDEPLTK